MALAACSGSASTPTAAPTPTPSPTAPATTAPATTAPPTLTIAYEENCQAELIAPSGQRILIDVYDPTRLTSPATSTDILLTTHTHSDHYLESFETTFPGKKITNKTTELTVGDIKIKSIAASHDSSPINPDAPSNHIFIIEFNGFKIVHGGSTGQLKLTPEQLSAIGSDVDVAFMVLFNTGGADPNDTKAIDMIEQVNPKLEIPTHAKLGIIQAAGKDWSATFSSHKTVTIPHDQLPAQTSLLLLGRLGPNYGVILKASETKW
jgi:L-ascorbate metabolism protein UlaG (beta-lactamase superfamily)